MGEKGKDCKVRKGGVRNGLEGDKTWGKKECDREMSEGSRIDNHPSAPNRAVYDLWSSQISTHQRKCHPWK